MSEFLPRVTKIQVSWNLSSNVFGRHPRVVAIRRMKGVILAIKESQFGAVDAILPPNAMIQVASNKNGYILNGLGLLEAAKVPSHSTRDRSSCFASHKSTLAFEIAWGVDLVRDDAVRRESMVYRYTGYTCATVLCKRTISSRQRSCIM